ncbi:MAG: polysaccharide deacetylase family protein [Cytophagales bacterium]|nr:polysaccharide deacetylase family protein [Bernardetiaceae bacterium]MDW8209765.1 polysaccharide deacetylase family protein [Cytophagales bacterium]
MRIHRIPRWIHSWLNGFTWRLPQKVPTLYLTFDDGPISLTNWVLDVLKDFQAQATFFCVGENIVQNPHIFRRIISHEHAVGNHTYNHLSGWRTSTRRYLKNAELCQAAIENHGIGCHLFRPPYGRITPMQAKALRQRYQLIMWEVLTCDYDAALSQEACLKNSIAATQSGSIVVFHDSFKAEKNLRYVLPRYLAHFAKLGFQFKGLSNPSVI